MKYILRKKPQGCVFCEKTKEESDKTTYILERSDLSYTILNMYPYNNGHLMVLPYRHIGDIAELSIEELTDIMKSVSRATKALKIALKPEGFNIGANIGKVAGAGIADHIHFHVVPRWNADTNFMPVIAKTNVIPESLESVYVKIKDALKELDG